MGKITIQRIAKELGFSRNTVSMALKGNEMVAPQTREMILKYARSLGYCSLGEPDAEPERKAADNTVYQIMILRKADVAVYWDKVISGISEEASRNNCQTQVAVVSKQDEKSGRLPLGLNESIHAVFCVNLLDTDYIRLIRRMGIEVYLLDNFADAEEPLGDIVKMESFHATAQLTRHLIGQGMKRIGFLNENSSVYETMKDRFDGYLYAMRCADLAIDPSIVIPDAQDEHFYEPETFSKIVEGFRGLPEAVVCGNDSIAKVLTQALRAKGVRVPEDVALTGFDNDEEGMLDPFFTTANVDVKWLGRRMVQCFLRRMKYPGAPYEKIMVYGEIILRKSSRR